jgi:hypothetical protein
VSVPQVFDFSHEQPSIVGNVAQVGGGGISQKYESYEFEQMTLHSYGMLTDQKEPPIAAQELAAAASEALQS